LRDTEKNILAAVVNAGLAATDIWRELPAEVRNSMLGSRQSNTIPESAIIPVALCVDENWQSGTYWGSVGKLEAVSLSLDSKTTERVISICRDLTGA
jgi:hypothetical protein